MERGSLDSPHIQMTFVENIFPPMQNLLLRLTLSYLPLTFHSEDGEEKEGGTEPQTFLHHSHLFYSTSTLIEQIERGSQDAPSH